MRTAWPLLLVFVAACGDSKPPAPAATTATATARPAAAVTAAPTATATAEASASAAPAPAPPPLATGQPLAGSTCTKQTASLGAWLKVLQAEGPFLAATPGISLVEANQAAGTLPPAPVVAIDASRLTLDGAQVASVKQAGFDAKPITEGLAKKMEAAKQAPGAPPTAGLYVLFEIDRAAPWHAVVAAADAAASAGLTYGTYLFAAPTTASAPPASSHHTDFHAKFGVGPDRPAEMLAPSDPEKPGVLGTIYKDCEAGLKVKHTPSEALAKELPKALTACGCKADMAAVQALAWAAYDRYSGVPRTGLTVNLAKAPDGAQEVSAAGAAPWSEASALLREAAGKGKPVKLTAK